MSEGGKDAAAAGGWMSSLSRWALGRASAQTPAAQRDDNNGEWQQRAAPLDYKVSLGGRRQPYAPQMQHTSRLNVLESFVDRFPTSSGSASASSSTNFAAAASDDRLAGAPRDYDSLMNVPHSARRTLRIGRSAVAATASNDPDEMTDLDSRKRRPLDIDSTSTQLDAKRVRVDNRAQSALAFKAPTFDDSTSLDTSQTRPGGDHFKTPVMSSGRSFRAASAMSRPASALHWANRSCAAGGRSSPAVSLFAGGGRGSRMFSGLSTRTRQILEELERASTPLSESKRMPAYKAELNFGGAKHEMAAPPVESLRAPTRAAALAGCTPSRIAALPYRLREGGVTAAASHKQRTASDTSAVGPSQRRKGGPVKSAAESGATKRSNVFSAKFLDDEQYDMTDDNRATAPPPETPSLLALGSAPPAGFLSDANFTFNFSKPVEVPLEGGAAEGNSGAADTSTSVSGGSDNDNDNESNVVVNDDQCDEATPAALPTNEKTSEKWQCVKCKLQNDADTQKCICCKTDKSAKPADIARQPAGNDWNCPDCMTKNKASSEQCPCCGAKKPGSSAAGTSASATGGLQSCSTCMVHNKADAAACVCCGTALSQRQRPPAAEPWSCAECWVKNAGEATLCAACQTPKAGSGAAPKTDSSGFKVKSTVDLAAAAANKPPGVKFGLAVSSGPPTATTGGAPLTNGNKSTAQKDWACTVCFVSNSAAATQCASCQAPAPAGKYAAISFGLPPSVVSKKVHFAEDKPSTAVDLTNGAPEHSFGAAKTSTENTAAAKPTFGLPPPAAANGGTVKANASPFQFGLSGVTAAPPKVGLPAASGKPDNAESALAAEPPRTAAPAESRAAAPATTTTAAASGLQQPADVNVSATFKLPVTTPTTAAAGGKTAFSCGAPPAATTGAATAAPAAPPTQSTAAIVPPVSSNFTLAFNSTGASGDKTTTGFGFGAGAKLGDGSGTATNAAAAGGGKSPFQFGAASRKAADDKSEVAEKKRPFTFGSPAATTATPSEGGSGKPLGLFGAPAAGPFALATANSLSSDANKVQTTAAPAFGQAAVTTSAAAPAAASPFAFGAALAKAPSQNANIFGAGATLTNGSASAPKTTAAATGGNLLFGAPAATTSVSSGTGGGFNFGAAAQAAAPSAFAFGAGAAAAAQPQAAQSGFGFGSAANDPSKGGFNFGGAAPAAAATTSFEAPKQTGFAFPTPAADATKSLFQFGVWDCPLAGSSSSPNMFQAAPASGTAAVATARKFVRARRKR